MSQNSVIKIESVEHSCIPEDIHIACSRFEPDASSTSPHSWRRREKEGGRMLVTAMASRYFGKKPFRIRAVDGEKPVATYGDEAVEISISHCRTLCSGALSKQRSVGIDIEPVGRKITPMLKSRMMSPEDQILCREIPTLRLWTIKESALKWCGMGLRHPMNRISVVNVDGECYTVRMMDGRLASCCSFQLDNYWMALTYTPDRPVIPDI